MKKIKMFFKKKYALCLIVLLISCMAISSTYNIKKNNNIVNAANTIIEEDFLYLLPQVITKTTSSSSTIFPSMLFGINSDGTPFLYTMTGNNPASSLRYVRRNFTVRSNTNRIFEYTYSPFLLFGGYSSTIYSSVFSGSQTATITYSSNLVGTTVLPVFTEGRVGVAEDIISYELANYDENGHIINFIAVSVEITLATSNSYNYLSTFYPTLISLSATGGASLNEAYEAGRRVGFSEGKAVGKQEGLNEANIFTFSNLISAVIDVPINSFKSLLNFNFLDINLLDFALSIITLFVVIKIVGVINGKA